METSEVLELEYLYGWNPQESVKHRTMPCVISWTCVVGTGWWTPAVRLHSSHSAPVRWRGVALRHFVLLSVRFHSDILMLSPSLATSQMQSIRVPAGDVERHKRRYFNKLSLSLLLLVQEQTQAGGVFLTPLARMRLHGVRAVAPSTAEVVCKNDALKNRLAG